MITEIIIAVCAVTATLISLYTLLGKKFDKIGADMKEIHSDLKEIQKDLRNIDSRMSRLEGGFTERGYWESRDKKIGE